MTIRFLIIFSLLTSYCLQFNAQDTISIKVKTTKPPLGPSQYRNAIGYSTPNQARLDLYDPLAKKTVSIPTNYAGTQDLAPNTTHYFGIATYNGKVSFNMAELMAYTISNSSPQFNDVGFVQVEIPTPMIKKEYKITFKVSLADNSGYATSGWGVYFSDKQIKDSANYSTSVMPQVTFSEMVTDKKGWTQLSAKYKTTGKEKFIAIGCFAKNNYKLEEVKGGKDFPLTKAYYYVSDIKFIEIPEDRDKDGVWDIKDKCPDTPGLVEFSGCPDTDADGVPDPDDVCPRVKGLIAFKGCPDTDADGIEDSKDKCPTVLGKPENEGCPEDEKEVATKNIRNAINSVQFEPGLVIIKGTSTEILDDIASILKEKPDLVISLGEFIDSDATDAAKAKELSNKRGLRILEYLISKGCNPEMIKFTGVPVEAKKPTTENTGDGRRIEDGK